MVGGFLPPNITAKVARFVGTVGADTEWQAYQLPRGVSMLHIFCMGGGGGGGGGRGSTAGSARGGGGSGASSGQVSLIIPAFFLPERLFVQAGKGGLGGAAGSSGNGGLGGSPLPSNVSVAPSSSNALNTIVTSNNSTPSGGAGGSAAGAAAAGSVGTVAALAQMPLITNGIFQALAGQAGVAGGNASGAAVTQTNLAQISGCACAGTAGAGSTAADVAGGVYNGINNTLISSYRSDSAAAGSNYGSGGYPIWKPMYFFGGIGGGSSNSGVGGDGGNASYGAGGGGGGAGVTTGGRGGDGGPGLVIITAW